MKKRKSPQISQQDTPQAEEQLREEEQFQAEEQLTEEEQPATEQCVEDIPAENSAEESAEELPAEKLPAEAENQEVESPRKKRKVYWIFLLSWSILLMSVLTGALIWFYHFLEDYQNVFESTRPKLYMESVMPVFTQKETERIVAMAEPVELCAYERTEHFIAFLDDYLAG